MELAMIFANNLKVYRKKLRLTKKRLAEKSGMSFKTITKLEAGFDFIRFKNLDRLADALEIPVTELFKPMVYNHDSRSADRWQRRGTELSAAFGKNLCFHMERKNLTLEKLAKLSELSDRTVYMCLSGCDVVKMPELDKIASALGIEPHLLFISPDKEGWNLNLKLIPRKTRGIFHVRKFPEHAKKSPSRRPASYSDSNRFLPRTSRTFRQKPFHTDSPTAETHSVIVSNTGATYLTADKGPSSSFFCGA